MARFKINFTFKEIEGETTASKPSPRMAQSARQRGAAASARQNVSPVKPSGPLKASPDSKTKEAKLESEIFALRNQLKHLQASNTPTLNMEKALDGT